MKILSLTQDHPPKTGGVAMFLRNLYVQLGLLGHELDVLTPARRADSADHTDLPYEVHRYHSAPRLSSVAPLWRTLALHWRNRYDLIFVGHFIPTHALGAVMLRAFSGVPYVILAHGTDLCPPVITTKLDGAIFARLTRQGATMFLANSSFTAQRVQQLGFKGPVGVLNPGVDLARFDPGVSPEPARQKYGLRDRAVMLTACRLWPRKNVQGVLRALPPVLERFPNLVYVIAGEGEERGKLEALTESLGLQKSVRFLGHVEDGILASLYCASDVFVMPSYDTYSGRDFEGFGIVFVEASASGLPVIGSRSGGVPDAVVDGETGLLVDPHSAAEISDSIIRLLTDKDLANRLGKAGRRRVEQEFGWEKVGKRLETFLESAVSMGRNAHRNRH